MRRSLTSHPENRQWRACLLANGGEAMMRRVSRVFKLNISRWFREYLTGFTGFIKICLDPQNPEKSCKSCHDTT